MKELNEGWEDLQLTSAPFLLLHPEQLFFQLLWGLLALHSSFLLVQISCFLLSKPVRLEESMYFKWPRCQYIVKMIKRSEGCNFFKRIQTGGFPLKKGITYPPRFICLSVCFICLCLCFSCSFFKSTFLINYIFKVKKYLSIGFYSQILLLLYESK